MTESLKCPECTAPLQYPSNGGPAVQCRFCGSTVLLPSAAGVRSVNPHDQDFAAGLGPLISKAMEMAQMSNHVRAGNKIDAIRIYRSAFGTDLKTAKDAVDNLSAGQPILLNGRRGGMPGSSPGIAAKNQINGGVVMATVIVIFVSVILALVFSSVAHHTVTTVTANTNAKFVMPTLPPAAMDALRTAQGLTPAAPTFATMTMKFGSKGMGAGQFKDVRSVAIDGNGKIYAADYSENRVQVFDSNGKFLKLWSIGNEKTSILNLAASRTGTVYVVTPGHILCFEGSTGLSLGEAAVTHDDDQESYMDAFAAVTGDIYALGGESHIVILDGEGHIKTVIDANQKVGETLNLCRVIVNGNGEIFALDRTKGIFKFASDGRYINRFGGSDPDDPASVSFGQNLAVDGQGRIYASGSNPAIRVFDSNGKTIDGFGGFDVVFGMAINDQNEIFACFRNQNEIRKFVINPKPSR
jgi:outer membrane protein assembly factor BamB